MRKVFVGFAYVFVLVYLPVIISVLTDGRAFKGIEQKLALVPFIKYITKDNFQELNLIINTSDLTSPFNICFAFAGIIIALHIGYLISSVIFAERELNA